MVAEKDSRPRDPEEAGEQARNQQQQQQHQKALDERAVCARMEVRQPKEEEAELAQWKLTLEERQQQLSLATA